MNHTPIHILSDGAEPLSRRALAKLRTRQALISAAKALFTAHGYADATVRGIARATGMSTGAVFANFADKADLFAEVLASDHQALNPALKEIAEGAGPATDILLAMYARAYAFHLAQLPLFQAAQAYAWLESAHRDRTEASAAPALTAEVLSRAVERGELPADLDVALAADLVWNAYISNYRLALRDKATLEDLTSRLERQIGFLLKTTR
jgi:AcrR family transcriptional regulator